jgi:hypothetical protein
LSVIVTNNVNVTTSPEAPQRTLGFQEQWALILRANAARRKPSPVCRRCGFPYQPGDADPFDARYCTSCGLRRTERRVYRLLRAKSKKARKRAIRRLLALSH